MQLTERESVVLAHIAQGLDQQAIAKIMDVKPSTVRKHRENIQQKLNAGKAALLVWHYVRRNPDNLKKSSGIRSRIRSLCVNWTSWNH